jgi:hypothetical protein
VYQVVVPKALAPKELVAVFESGERVVLPPWDPMVWLFLVTYCALLIVFLLLLGHIGVTGPVALIVVEQAIGLFFWRVHSHCLHLAPCIPILLSFDFYLPQLLKMTDQIE